MVVSWAEERSPRRCLSIAGRLTIVRECRHFEKVTRRLTANRRWLFAVATVLLAVVVPAGGVLLVDVYLHHRVENLGAVNVWGYRGPTIGAKRSGETRVVVLGGSTAFGYGLPWNEAFPYYLEEMLRAHAAPGHTVRVVNLGAPGQGVYGFRFDLADYAYLQYDVAIFYEGYNDLGSSDLPAAVPPRDRENRFLWRRQSPVFALTGYFPVLPLVFREKAMALRAGGDLDGAYRGRVLFKPGLARRATAAAIGQAAAVADAVGRSLGRLTPLPASDSGQPVDTIAWRPYTTAVLDAVREALARGSKVIVVTQPYASDTHRAQQAALAAALTGAFAAESAVRYVNLGVVVDLRDPDVAYDGLHLTAAANRVVAAHLVQPVLGVLK